MTNLLTRAGVEPMRPLVQRLRDAAAIYPWMQRLCDEAANEIERLRAKGPA